MKARPRTLDDRDKMLRRFELGQYLRNRRDEVGPTQGDVARAIGWEQSTYAGIELGQGSTESLRAWVIIADQLQLPREDVLRRAWQARGTLPLALPEDDEMRSTLLRVAIEQANVRDVLRSAESRPAPQPT